MQFCPPGIRLAVWALCLIWGNAVRMPRLLMVDVRRHGEEGLVAYRGVRLFPEVEEKEHVGIIAFNVY